MDLSVGGWTVPLVDDFIGWAVDYLVGRRTIRLIDELVGFIDGLFVRLFIVGWSVEYLVDRWTNRLVNRLIASSTDQSVDRRTTGVGWWIETDALVDGLLLVNFDR